MAKIGRRRGRRQVLTRRGANSRLSRLTYQMTLQKCQKQNLSPDSRPIPSVLPSKRRRRNKTKPPDHPLPGTSRVTRRKDRLKTGKTRNKAETWTLPDLILRRTMSRRSIAKKVL